MSDRPRILLIGGDGGLSGVPRHLCHVIQALGDDARIAVAHDRNRGGYDFVRNYGAESIEVEGLATQRSPKRLWQAWRWVQSARTAGRYDLIWAHARMSVLFLRLGPHRSATPLMLTYHGLPFDPGHRPWARRIGRLVEAALLRLAPAMTLVVLSKTAAEDLRAALPKATARHRVLVLPNSSDLRPLPMAPRSDAPQIVMTGRASWQKNLVAAGRMLERWPEARLTMCGDGTKSNAFTAELQSSIAADTLARIERAGPVPDVRPALSRADLYLMTSRYEGVPIGALEAFEAGLPLAMPCGHHDLLDHHPLSAAIDPNDPDEVADAAQALV
ncbi:MAG: glycosyltransferase family 4 protein, partial [Pseudomonadota bacterium]